MRFTKTHATGNDFILTTDQQGRQDVDGKTVAQLCDRHLGIGADGFIRAVYAHRTPRAAAALAKSGYSSSNDEPVWYMDYRNADGSTAEICGNGVRAFVDYLVSEELVELADGENLEILTRAGIKAVHKVEEGYAVSMGVWSFIDPELAVERASDSLVTVDNLPNPRPGLSISMGNPHTVVALPDTETLESLRLYDAPEVDPKPKKGSNVEFVVPGEPLVDEDGVGWVSMRVYERGVGETLSCGTGACAAAAATRVWAANEGVDVWVVSVPGGEVMVSFTPREDGTEEVILSGPVTKVYTGDLIR